MKEILEPESVNAIITDPPYPEEFIPLYGELASLGAYVLKPGGSLLAMCPQRYLPDILDLMRPHLQYHWVDANLTGHNWPKGPLFHDRVMSQWKPIIWFTKGDYQGNYVPDIYQKPRTKTSKKFHKWQQDEKVISEIIENYTNPGDTILDPFCCTGTTVRCSVRLGRKAIGSDIDGSIIEVANREMCTIKGIIAYD
jgi:site-specific DNA-methyltransferase (adenine-specific)